MDSRAVERLHARARAVRTRSAIRRWQYRQRDLAAGVWYRLRRVLADAQAAYVVSDEDARRLVADGALPQVCGMELVPPKTILFVDETGLAAVESRRPIPVALGPDFLTASAVVLLAFEGVRHPGGPQRRPAGDDTGGAPRGR